MVAPVVLFGERPGPQTDPARPLYPHTTTGAAAKLIRLLGTPRDAYLAGTTRVNAYHNGEQVLGLDAAREHVRKWMTVALATHPNPRFVVVGAEALRALPQFYRSMQFLEVRDTVLLLPHTSGVNRWYNSAENTAAAAAALQQHVAGAVAAPTWRAERIPGAVPPQHAHVAPYPPSEVVAALQRALPGARPLPPGPGRRYEELEWMLQRWSAETSFHSSVSLIMKHSVPATLLREEGLRVVPLLISKLRAEDELQFWGCCALLARITRESPWPPEQAGQSAAMRASWLAWYDGIVPQGG